MDRRATPEIDRAYLARLLDVLASAGVRVRDGVTVEKVAAALAEDGTPTLKEPVPGFVGRLAAVLGRSEPRGVERTRATDFEALLATLGNERCTEDFSPLPPLSADIAHLDVECVEDHGSYVTFVERMAALAGDIRLYDAVRDSVDVEAGHAWVEFVANGETSRMDLVVDHDWLDGRIIDALVERLAQCSSDWRFAKHDLGQDFLVVCRTPKDIDALNQMTGLSFRIVG